MEDSVPVTNRIGDVIECSIQDVLVEKHPNGKPASPSALLSSTQSHVNPIIFDQLNWELILKAAMCNQGAPGLSGMDAYAWRRICSSFKSASHDLYHVMAAVARRICCSPIHPDDMSAFVTCHLIPLDKRPGICPIGIGETPTRIIAKAVLMLLQHDILDSAGPLQVCAGEEGGCEAAVHAMRHIFEDPLMEGVLLVYATSAFNPLTPIVHFWVAPRTRPLSLAHKQHIGVCPIALESAVFKELHHLCSMGIGHSQRELRSVKEAIQSCVR